MSSSSQALAKKGTYGPITAGERVRIDPGLRNARGGILAPDDVILSDAFICASIQNDPLQPATFGTFDIQNISSEERSCDWIAIYEYSTQYNHRDEIQTGLGTLGADPSPDAAIAIGGGAGGVTVDVDFTAQASEDLKASGDGLYTYDGQEFTASGVAASQTSEIINGTGLMIEAGENQELRPSANISTAPQLRRSLSALLEALGASETDGLRLWMRIEASNITSDRESIGFGVISSGANPARFVAAIKTNTGIDLAHHAPASIAARGEVSNDNSPDVLVLEKAPGIDVWTVRAGSWVGGFPDINETVLLGGVSLSVMGITLVVGASAGMTRYSELDFVLFVSNVAGAATDYLHAQSAGDRRGTIAITNTLTTSGNVNLFVDGDKTTTGLLRWNNSEPVAGKYVAFDFGTPLYCNEVKLYVAATPVVAHGTWRWEGSNDALLWDIISPDFVLQGSDAGAVIGDLSANTTNYQHIRLLGVSGNSSNTQWLFELEFKLSIGLSSGLPTDYDAVGIFKNFRAEKF